MEKAKGKSRSRRKLSAVKNGVGRAVALLLLISLAVGLVLWDRGVLSLPFLPARARQNPSGPSPEKPDDFQEIVDFAAYRAEILKALYAFSDVDDGYLRITGERFDYAKMTLTLSPAEETGLLQSSLPRLLSAGGFLQVLSDQSAAYSIPAEQIAVTSSDRAAPLFDRRSDGKLLFLSSGGDYLVWNYDAGTLVPAEWDPAFSLGYSFFIPADWVEKDPPLSVFLDPATGLYGYGRETVDESGETVFETVVEAQYIKAYPYHEGVAVMVDPSSREYLRDASGAVLFPERTFWASEAEGEEAAGFFSMQNGILRVLESAQDSSGAEVFREVLLQRDGTEFVLPSGFSCTGFSEGVFRVTNGDLTGYYSTEGVWVADPVYLYGGIFLEGVAVVQSVDGLYGAIDLEGREQVPPAFSYLSPMAGGLMTLYSPETGWYLLYKTSFVPQDRQMDAPPVTTLRPFVTRIPISRDFDPHGGEEDIPYIFSTVLPSKRTTVPEWTLTPRPDFTTTSVLPPDPTEPSASNPEGNSSSSSETSPVLQPPDPPEPARN